MNNSLKLVGYSTALFSTWYFVEQYGILFDCGDGASAHLMQKARKVKHCFVSHADRDHVTGLLQFQQLNGRPELKIHYPNDSGSFPALAQFTANFDPHISGTQWNGLRPDDVVNIRDNLVVRAIENGHVRTDGVQTKSLSYIVEHIRRKLKPEFVGLAPTEIANLRKERGADRITQETRSVELIYSGDTPLESDGRYLDAKVLIHEATFLTRDEIDPDDPKRNKHSSLDDVMQMVAECNVQTLVLGHFSSRYSSEQITESVERERVRCGVKIPIHCVLPGEIARLET